MLPFLQTACNCKIIKASVLLTFIKGRGDRYLTVGLYTWCPETIVNVHLSEGYLLYGRIRTLVGFRACACGETRQCRASRK